MSTTTWGPRPNPQRRWVLTDGTVLTEPDAEISGSGRRVRIKGQSQSHPAGDYDSIVIARIDEQAKARRRKVWFPVKPEGELKDDLFTAALTETVRGVRDDLIVLRPGTRRGEMHLWWRFEHKSLPVAAMIGIRVTGMTVQTRMSTQRLTVDHEYYSHNSRMTGQVFTEGPAFYEMQRAAGGSKLDNLVTATPPNWADLDMEAATFATDKALVEGILAQARAVDDYAYIEVPDTRTGDTWLRLDLATSNWSGALERTMADYLQTSPIIDEAMEHYKKFRDALHSTGLNFGDIDATVIHQMLEGHDENLTVPVGAHVLGVNGRTDGEHVLHCHLDSGTFVVVCDRDAPSQEETSLAWEESLMIAQLTGQEDTLLAYAKAHAAQAGNTKARKVVRRRRRGR